MEKFIPFEKLSKKKQRELNAKRRVTWGALDPVTRKPKNPKAYDRQKARRNSRSDFSVPFPFRIGPSARSAAIRFHTLQDVE